jgi:hypothetical protein
MRPLRKCFELLILTSVMGISSGAIAVEENVARCALLFKQASECYAAAANFGDPDHGEGAELQCDVLYRAMTSTCGDRAEAPAVTSAGHKKR